MTPDQFLRRCVFRPYRAGMGPTFFLLLWDTYRLYHGGPQQQLGYRLTMRDGRTSTVLFEGKDFGASPCDAIDSDATVRALMGFLTLRPGDTDSEYFADYTDTQRDYCAQHAEALAACYWRGKLLTED